MRSSQKFILLLALASADLAAEKIPSGLAASDWNGIRAEYERNRHAAFRVGDEFRARNFSQRWLTHFDRRGFSVEPEGADWRWGLALESYGFAGSERVVQGRARTTSAKENVTYTWDRAVDEWFVNDQRGLEHGFTLRQRPPGRVGLLGLRLSVRGGLQPRVHADGQGISFVDRAGRPRVEYAGLKAWDANGKLLAARIEVAGGELHFRVDESTAYYPITIDPIAQQAYLKASNTGEDDQFGYAVAISGDTVVVGAPNEQSNATDVNGNQSDDSVPYAGAVYVFVRSGGTWSQQAYLKASNTGEAGFFGVSVAISGDTIVVGSYHEDSNATGVNGNQNDDSAVNAGAAYVFVRSGGLWTQQAYLKGSNTEAGDDMGIAVAIDGDTVVVGAWGEDSSATGVNGNQSNNSATDSGAAYVFVRSGTTWTQQAYLKPSNTGGNDQFGGAVAIDGNTAVVGSWFEDSSATGIDGNQSDNTAADSGAAYVFVRSGTTWTQQAYLKASNTGAGDYFGYALAVSGNTAIVGAYLEDSNATGVNGNQSNNSAADSGQPMCLYGAVPPGFSKRT